MARIMFDIDDKVAKYLERQADTHLRLPPDGITYHVASYMAKQIVEEKVAEHLGRGPLSELWDYFVMGLILPSMALFVALTLPDLSWADWLWMLALTPVAAFVMALMIFFRNRQAKCRSWR